MQVFYGTDFRTDNAIDRSHDELEILLPVHELRPFARRGVFFRPAVYEPKAPAQSRFIVIHWHRFKILVEYSQRNERLILSRQVRVRKGGADIQHRL